MSAAEPGDWVKVLAIVVEGAKHPDDTLVRFESHNVHFIGHVRDDMVEPAEAPSWQPRCPSLYQLGRRSSEDEEGDLTRCAKPYEHSDVHQAKDPVIKWTDAQEYGTVEM